MKMSRPISWRDLLPIHPAAALFPRMSSDELRELGKDIRTEKRQLKIKAVGLRSEIDVKAPAEGAPKARAISELLATLPQLDTSMTNGEIDAIGATLKSDARARLREAARTLLAIVAAVLDHPYQAAAHCKGQSIPMSRNYLIESVLARHMDATTAERGGAS